MLNSLTVSTSKTNRRRCTDSRVAADSRDTLQRRCTREPATIPSAHRTDSWVSTYLHHRSFDVGQRYQALSLFTHWAREQSGEEWTCGGQQNSVCRDFTWWLLSLEVRTLPRHARHARHATEVTYFAVGSRTDERYIAEAVREQVVPETHKRFTGPCELQRT